MIWWYVEQLYSFSCSDFGDRMLILSVCAGPVFLSSFILLKSCLFWFVLKVCIWLTNVESKWARHTHRHGKRGEREREVEEEHDGQNWKWRRGLDSEDKLYLYNIYRSSNYISHCKQVNIFQSILMANDGMTSLLPFSSLRFPSSNEPSPPIHPDGKYKRPSVLFGSFQSFQILP